MSDSAGAAKRRRVRLLRAWHRHVHTTVAMELATALHHSAQRVEVPREGEIHEKHVVPRAQKRPLPGTRPQLIAMALAEALHHSAGPSKKKVVERRERQEEAGSETYYAPWGPKTLPPGMRRTPLAEVAGPLGASSHGRLRCCQDSSHLVGSPLLADSSAEVIDGRTLRNLLKMNLARKEEEEEDGTVLFFPLGEKEEEEEEEKETSSDVWPRSSSSTTVACSWLVFCVPFLRWQA